MRTFPKSLAKFRDIVDERGQRLRGVPFEELKHFDGPSEQFEFDGRSSRISIIVQPQPSGGIRVVVQGFMKAKVIGWDVALHGFYKYPDETIAEMAHEEFYEFD